MKASMLYFPNALKILRILRLSFWTYTHKWHHGIGASPEESPSSPLEIGRGRKERDLYETVVRRLLPLENMGVIVRNERPESQ